MHFIWFLIVGAVVGALGRLIHPGSDSMSLLLTLAIGVVSMLVAALISGGWLAFVLGVVVHERSEHVVSPSDGLLARAPRRADQVVMQDRDLERRGLRRPQPLLGRCELARANPARLVAPGAHGVEADHVQRGGGVRRL